MSIHIAMDISTYMGLWKMELEVVILLSMAWFDVHVV